MKRFPVPEWAASTLQIYGEEDWSEDAPDIQAAVSAFRGGALHVDASTAKDVVSGLVDLSNTEDDVWEEERKRGRRRDPERARYARYARDGLSGLATRVSRAFR